MADEVIAPTGEASPESTLSDGDKQALARARGEGGDYTSENFNEDGTPKDDFKMPEKFEGKSADEIARAYVELEKLKAKQADTAPLEGVEDKEEAKATDTTPDTIEDAEKLTEGFKPEEFKTYEEAYIKDGKLSDDHYKELATKGFSKDMVDAYIAGQTAIGQNYANSVYAEAGGEQGYNELIEWAKTNLSDVAKKDFDAKITSGDLEMAKLAVSTVQAQKGTPPRRIDGTSNQDNGGIKPFSDRGEWQEAVRNPLYGKDKKYSMMVDKRYIGAKRAGKL